MDWLGETLAGLMACLGFVLVGMLLLSTSSTHRQTLNFQFRLLITALALRFLASVVIYQVGFGQFLGEFDAVGWLYGSQLREVWVGNKLGLVDLPMIWKGAFAPGNETLGMSPHLGYYYLLGTIFMVTGAASRMVAAALNCFLGALIVVFTYRTARSLFSERTAERVGWWTCLFPSMIIWSAQTIKEPVVILLEVLALYGCVRLKQSGFALKYVVLCAVSIVFMTPFRFYAAYIGVAAVGLSLVMPNRRGRFAFGSAVAIGLFLVVLVAATNALATGEAKIEQFDIDFIQKFRRDLAEGSGSGLNLNVDMRTTTGFSMATAVGAAHLLLAPFPWQIGGASLRMLLTLPELAYWWWLFFVGVVPGLWYCSRRRLVDIVPLLVFMLGLGLLYSMTFGNIGVVFRQRAQLLPWLFIFAGVGLELRERRIEQRKHARALMCMRLRTVPEAPPAPPRPIST
jgi:hypothetical protein